MEAPDELTFHAVPHPRPKVREVGFELDHPYLEHVSVAVMGPTSVLLLRRLPLLWRFEEPARVSPSELSRSLGLKSDAAVSNSRLMNTINRLSHFGLARWTHGAAVQVYTQVPPLPPRLLDRLPEWSRQMHDRLLGEQIARLTNAAPSGVDPPFGHIAARLDRLERPGAPSIEGLAR